jgi:hypothetical protein
MQMYFSGFLYQSISVTCTPGKRQRLMGNHRGREQEIQSHGWLDNFSGQHWLGCSNPKFRCSTLSKWFWVRFSCSSLLAKGNSSRKLDHVYKQHQQSTFTIFPWWWRPGWSLKCWNFNYNWHGFLPEKIYICLTFLNRFFYFYISLWMLKCIKC